MNKLNAIVTLPKKAMSCIVAVSIVIISCVSVLQIVSAEDSTSMFDDTIQFSDSFGETSLGSMWNKQQTTDGYNCSIANNNIVFAKGNAARSAVYLNNIEYYAVNQYASIDFVSNNDQKQVLWLRYESYGKNNAATGSCCRGYYAQYACGGQEILIYRYVNINNKNIVNNIIGSFGWNNSIKNGTKCRMEMVATGCDPTLLSVKIYNYDSTNKVWKMFKSNNYVDDTTDLQKAGTVAIAGNGSANIGIDSVKYSSTDNIKDNYYIEKTEECKNGVYCTFGQVVTLEPGKEYVYSVRRKIATNQASPWIELCSDANGMINNKTRLLTSVKECDSQTLGGYNTLTYTFKVPTTGVEINNSICWYNNNSKVGRTRVIVGFRIDGSVNTGVFSHFELYAKDDEKKANLIVNPDFNMGLYGWDDNFGVSSYAFWYPDSEGTTVSKNGRIKVVSANDDEYESIFGVPKDREPLSFLTNTYYKLTETKELSIGYIGGSVTSGYGASDADVTSWRGLTTSWFKEKFPDANISAFNAAIGSTGSYSAAFRYTREVAPKSPDLLFIEFAVNDYYNKLTYNQSLRNVESVVRQAYDYNPYIEIVVVLTADKWCRSEEYDSYKALKAIADAYDFMCIDIRKDFLMTLSDSEYITYMRDNSDGVHPNDNGYKKYFELIEKKLSKDIILDQEQKVEFSSKKLPTTNVSTDPLMLSADSVRPDEIKLESNNGWTVKNQGFSYLSNRGYLSVITANTPGSELSFKFNGTDIGLFINKASDCGKISITIDGVNLSEIDSYQASQNHSAVICGWNLAEQQHTVNIKLLSDKNELSTGTNFTIGAFLLNSSPLVNAENNYMIQNMGTREYGKFGQIFKLNKASEYIYSVSYKYINQNGSQPIIMYKDSATASYKTITDYTFTEDDNYYRLSYKFTVPNDAYSIGNNQADILVGYTLGKKNSSGYFYNFELVSSTDGNKTNLFVNPQFKEGFKGWTGDAVNYEPITAEGELIYNKGEAKLKVVDESLFKKKTLSGKYMVHNTGLTSYMKFGQLFEVEPGSSFNFSCKVKYVKAASCKPIILYFKKSDPNKHAEVQWSKQTDDKDHSMFYGEFTVPDDANVLSNSKVEVFVGYTTGALGADVYFADLNVYKADDNSKTNLFTNSDFKYGLMNWRCDSRATPVQEYGLTIFSNESSELLPYEEKLFVNDSNDHYVDDGDWFSSFGPDENFDIWMKRVGAYYEKTKLSGEEGEWIEVSADDEEIEDTTYTENTKKPKKVLKKRVVKRIVNDNSYIWIIVGGCSVLVIAGAVAFFVLRKKTKKRKCKTIK